VCDLVSLLIAAGVSRVVVPVWVVSPLEGSNRYRLEALRAVIVVPLRAASPLRVAIVLVSPLADSNRRSFKGCNAVREHQFVSASNPSRFRSGFDFVAVLRWELERALFWNIAVLTLVSLGHSCHVWRSHGRPRRG